jgi:hypothetical protein
MRSRLVLAMAGLLCLVVLTAAFVRWFYFSQTAHPFVRLSEERFPRLTDRLVLVLVDSVPFDMAFDPRKMPFLASLQQRATWGHARTEEPTMTGQMVYTIVTGARSYLYGVVRNWRQNRFSHETFFDGLASAGLRIHVYGDVPWEEMFGDRFTLVATQPEEGRTAAGRPVIWKHAVNELDQWVVRRLDRGLADPDFDLLIWHVHGTDLVMHKYLRDTRLTADKLHWADLLLEGLVRQLDDGRTTFLLLSDHGCAENGRHGYEDPEARDTFYAIFGPKIVPGQRRDILQVDFSATVSALFGRTPAAPSTGRPLVEGLAISPSQRAARLVAAAANRHRYLKAREARVSTGVRPDVKLLAAARSAWSAGRYAVASQRATRLLRASHRADLDARRERRVAGPVLFWLAFLLALGGWAALLVRSAPPGTLGEAAGRGQHLVAAALLVLATWTLALLGSKYAGRLFNDHIDLWSPLARLGFWAAVAGGPVAVAWLLRRRLSAALRAQPVLWAWSIAVVAGVLPGYFQGIYSLVGLMAALGLVLVRRPSRGPRPWVAVLVALAIFAVALVWEYHWRPWFYFTRDYVEGGLGAALATAGFLVALALVGRPWRRRSGDADQAPRLLWPGLVLAALLAVRHLLWPGPTRFDVVSAGDHLLAQINVKVLALAVFAGAWLVLRRFGLRGREGAALGALALLGAWSSPFEATAFGLLTAALAPLGRARWLGGAGLAPAAAAAACLVLARSVFVMPHEFYFNFTAVHDLMRFAADIDTVAGPLAAPVLLRYTLPALVLLPLLWGRLDARQQLTALLLSLLYAGARALHLLMVTRLTIDQLYANWRGVGELIITGLWALGLAVAFAGWWVGGWADRMSLNRRALNRRAGREQAAQTAD